MNVPDHVLSIQADEQIQLSDIWTHHDTYIFRASNVDAAGPFYPVYKYQDLYAFSPFPLLLKKGTLKLTPDFGANALATGSDVAKPNPLIDRDIVRLGGPVPLTRALSDRDGFVTAFSDAVKGDVRHIEDLNPGKTNIVLCGGKDSLNLLLLDWQNPVIAYSADPNFPLVQQFVDQNDLDIEVRLLEDKPDPELRQREIAESFGQVNLENWKWAPALRDLSRGHSGQVIIWKGQVADLFLTDYWRSYTSRSNRYYQYLKKGYRRIAKIAPGPADLLFKPLTWPDLERSIWERSGVLQGAHMGFLRSICDCLVVSAYHGPKTQAVWSAMDFPRLVNEDLRPVIGRALLGREVWYPEANPSPPASDFRRDWRSIENFVDAVRSFGINVET